MTDGEYKYALMVLHKGVWKMVARLYRHMGVYVCLHEERRPTQRHHNTNSFGGIDYDVIEQLKDWQPILGRVRVIHRDGKTGPAWTLWADEIPLKGTRQTWDERDRYFVPEPLWTKVVFTDDTRCPLEHKIEPRGPVNKPKTWQPIKPPEPPAPKVDRRHKAPPKEQAGFNL